MRIIALVIVLFLPVSYAAAQYGNVWYFGRNAGLDFSTNPPTSLSNGALNTYEGCASFSDINGHILFYTDGVTVYSKNHTIMQNGTGLKGDPSATQSGIIVPWPGNDSLYYIFTADAYQNNFVNGNTYSVVNIKANGGFGSVITKNVKLYPEKCTEKIAISKHANGVDWWVVTKEYGNNRFRVFKIDNNGIDLNPVITDIGTAHTGSTSVGAGCMRVSADGKKLALAIGSFATSVAGTISETNLFDFDNNTGAISNFVNIPGLRPYGIEFSPDSKLLYVSYEPYSTLPLIGRIEQFNVSLPPTDLLASRTRITPDNFPGKPCGMQIAPDGKIYIVRENSMVMDVINAPNTAGTACNYQVSYVKLSKQNGMMPPNIISSFLIPVEVSIKLDTLNFCNRNVKFSANSNYSSILSYKWNFGDGDTSNLANPDKSFTRMADTFDVSLSVVVKVPRTGALDSIIETKTIVRKVVFDAKPKAAFIAESSCGSKTVNIKDNSVISNGSISNLYWDFGNAVTRSGNINTYAYSSFGTYSIKHVAKSASGCPSDTVATTVIIRDKPKVAYGEVALCNNVAGLFNNESSIASPDVISAYLWNFSDGTSSTLASPSKSFPSGSYTVKLAAISDKGCFSDTLTKTIIVEDFPKAGFTISGGCSGFPVQFTDSSAVKYGTIKKWQWNLGNGAVNTASSPLYTYILAGNYTATLQVSTANGCSSLPVSKPLRIESTPVAAFENTVVCLGQQVSFSNKSTIEFGELSKYNWSFGDGNSSDKRDEQYTYKNEGTFHATLTAISKNGCVSPVFTRSFYVNKMSVSAGHDTIAVLGQPFTLSGSGGVSFRWSPGSLLNNDTAQFPVTILQADQLFRLVAANVEGCKASAQVMIKVYRGPHIYVPNAFSPDGNGKNDLLRPIAAGVRYEYFRVFNRWGQILFGSNGTDRGWDGNFNNMPQPAGTYIWMVRGTTEKGEIIADQGTVVLIR